MSVKHYITPDSLRLDSYRLAAKVVQDGFKPDYMVAIWRGGAPIGCCVHEFLKRVGQTPDHITIRTSRYTGIDQVGNEIQVHNLAYLLERLKPDSKILLVDDVWDKGLTIEAVIQRLQSELGDRCPVDIRTAVVYYKPARNQTKSEPAYYVHTSDQWLVFPHELEGMSLDEIASVVDPTISDLVSECGGV